MTNKEAIDYLRPVADSTPLAGYGLALNLAIKALETVEGLERGKNTKKNKPVEKKEKQAKVVEKRTKPEKKETPVKKKPETKDKPVKQKKEQGEKIGKRKDLKRRERTVACQICGDEFIGRTNNAKYCDKCRSIATKAKIKERNKQTTVKVSGDTDEMMKLCLNCTRYNCPGECEELANLVRDAKRQREKTSGGKAYGT